MPRWPADYQAGRKQTCTDCGGRKDYYAGACRMCSIRPRPFLGRKGPSHPAWKGGCRVDRDGYIRTYMPDHPWPRRGRYVLEHVRVMELHIGRRIRPGEVVHHQNGNRQDNRIVNLELQTASMHSSSHRAKDKHLQRRNPVTGQYAGKEVLNVR